MESERPALDPADLAAWLGIGPHGVLTCRSAWVDSPYKGALVLLTAFGLTFSGYVVGLAGQGWFARTAPLASGLLSFAFILAVCSRVTEIQATVEGLTIRRGRRRARVAWDDLRPISRKIHNHIVYLRLAGGGHIFWVSVSNRATLRLAQTIRRIETARQRGFRPPHLPPPADEALSRQDDVPPDGPRSLLRVGARQD